SRRAAPLRHPLALLERPPLRRHALSGRVPSGSRRDHAVAMEGLNSCSNLLLKLRQEEIMPVPGYGVLIGGVSDRRLATPKKNHYEVRVEAAGESYRLAVNVQSGDGSEVLYRVDETFTHPMTAALAAMTDGHHTVASKPGGVALDFVRGNLGIKRADFVPLPLTLPGDDNDLNDKIDHYVMRAMSESGARVYAFGSFFKNPGVKDTYFDFKPGQGIHDIHFNQGNSAQFKNDDGIWQDGAMLFHFAKDNRWVAIFLGFQN